MCYPSRSCSEELVCPRFCEPGIAKSLTFGVHRRKRENRNKEEKYEISSGNKSEMVPCRWKDEIYA